MATPVAVRVEDADGYRILLVDDETTIRLALAELLETEGYVVETARDGAEALERLHRQRPDAVLLDLMMPVMDGWTLLRTCRSEPALHDLPVIVMSARLDMAQSVVEFAVQACLVKPFDVDELLQTLVKTWRMAPGCAICRASGARHALPVFIQDGRTVTWRFCGSCWRLLEAGFERLQPARLLAAYLYRPGFQITDAEVRGYIRVGPHPGQVELS